eukprot:gene15639-23870_t
MRFAAARYGFELDGGPAAQWQLCWLLAFTSLSERRLAKMMRAYDAAHPDAAQHAKPDAPRGPKLPGPHCWRHEPDACYAYPADWCADCYTTSSDCHQAPGSGRWYAGAPPTCGNHAGAGDARTRGPERPRAASRAQNVTPPAGPRAAGGSPGGARALEPERWAALYGGAGDCSQSRSGHGNLLLLDVLACVLEHAGAVETRGKADAALVRIAMAAIRRQEARVCGAAGVCNAVALVGEVGSGPPFEPQGGGGGEAREGGEGHGLRLKWRNEVKEVGEVDAFQAPHQHAVLWDQKSKERFMMTLTVRSIPLPWSSNDNNSSSCTPAPRGLASRGARREENPRGPPVIEALPEQAPRLSWSPDRSESPDDRTNDYSPRNADIRAKPYATTRGAILDDDADMRGAQGRSDRNDRPRDTVVGRDSIRNIRNQRGNRDADQRNFPSGRSWDMDRDRGDFRDRVADRAPADANFGGRDHGRNMSRDADFRDRNVDRAPRDADFKGRDFARNDSRDADFKGGRNADRGPADGGIRGRGFDRNNSRDADFRGRGFDRNNSRDADFRGRGFDRNKDADFRGRGFDRNNSRDAGFKGGHGDGSSADAGFRGKGAVRDPAFRSSRDRDGGDRNWGRDTESRPDDLFQRDRRGRQDSPDTRAEKQDVDDRRDRLDSKDSRGRKNSVGSRREKPQENKKSKSREKVKEKKSEEKIREEKPKKRRKSSSSSESLRGESPPRRRGRSEGKRSKKGRRSVTDRSSTRSSSESSRSTSGSSTGSTSSSGTRSPTPMRVFSTAEISRMTVDEIKPLLEERKTAWKDFRATFEKYQSRPPTTLDLELRVYRHEKVLFEQCKLLQEAKTAIKEKEKAKKEKKDKKDKKDKKSKEPEKDEKKDKKDKKDKK